MPSPPSPQPQEEAEVKEGRWGVCCSNLVTAVRLSQALTHFLQKELKESLSSPFMRR